MANPRILITTEPLNTESVVKLVKSTSNGSVVTFEGTTRDETNGQKVVRLEYEAYPEMAEKIFQQIFDEVLDSWGLSNVAVAHRIGGGDLRNYAVCFSFRKLSSRVVRVTRVWTTLEGADRTYPRTQLPTQRPSCRQWARRPGSSIPPLPPPIPSTHPSIDLADLQSVLYFKMYPS